MSVSPAKLPTGAYKPPDAPYKPPAKSGLLPGLALLIPAALVLSAVLPLAYPTLALTGIVAGATELAAAGGILYGVWRVMKPEQTLEDMLRHIYLLGATGSGKTSKILADILLPWVLGFFTPTLKQKPGALIIETKDSESVNDILNSIPESEHDRVIVFDPYDMVLNAEYIGLNVLEKNYDLKTVKTLVGGETISVFNRMWAGFIGPSSEDIIRNITLANLDQPEPATILENYRMIADEAYRAAATENIDNPVLQSYFENMPDPEKNTGMFNPPLNKLRSFLTDSLALNILGQRRGLNIRQVIEEGKILVMCLPKGLIGEPLSKLLASIAISKAQLAAFSRADMPKKERLLRPFMVICDEFQDYCNASFYAFLEQARSMGISLVLSHQLLNQNGVDEKMIDSVFGNVGTFYVGCCPNDAAKIAKLMETGNDPEPVTTATFKKLPNFTFIAKKIINGKRTNPKKEKSPVPPPKGDWAAKLREQSLEKYGISLSEIEADIYSRLGLCQSEVEVGKIYASN